MKQYRIEAGMGPASSEEKGTVLESVSILETDEKEEEKQGNQVLLSYDNDESSSRESVFMQSQVTLVTRKFMLSDEGCGKQEDQAVKNAVEWARAAHPKVKLMQAKRPPPVGMFYPGEEDVEEEAQERMEWEEEIDLSENPEMEGFVDPVGQRMYRIEMALNRNATEELDSSDREHAKILVNPCEALQDMMSESSSSYEGEVLKIRKRTTEITQAELSPWDKTADSRLSATFGKKAFDVVDTLEGFERAGTGLGIRTGDQTYNQIRSRFLAAKTGSYKKR
ncbi:hypothetical protein T484DRAFT_2582984 [Baffinella frigidus]|nr:hypothetical protein T484DRAFT_2582984 [Cryptophyta sp. CCMP2293]